MQDLRLTLLSGHISPSPTLDLHHERDKFKHNELQFYSFRVQHWMGNDDANTDFFLWEIGDGDKPPQNSFHSLREVG